MAEQNQQAFFVDDELIERLLRGDSKPAGKSTVAASTAALADAIGHAEAGRLDEAAKVLDAAGRRGEDPAEVHAALGHVRFEQQRWEEATACYAKVTALDSQNASAHYNLGLALERLGKFGEAATAFEAAVGRNPKMWQASVGLGLCLLHGGQWESSLRHFDVALRAQPDNERAQFGKAVALHQLGRLDEAGDWYRRLLPSNSSSEDLLLNLIALAGARNDEAQVQEYCERLLKIRPQSRPALESLAALALSHSDYNAAAQQYGQVVKLSDSYQAWFNLGVVHHRSGKLDQAVLAYNEAARLDPNSAEVQANRGAALQQRGEVVPAVEAYHQALANFPEMPGVLWNLGIQAEQAGQLLDAEQYFERLVKIAPEFEDAAYRLGFLQLQRGEYASAVDSFELCVKQRPDWADAWWNLGLASWKFEDLDSAAEIFERMLQLDANNVEALRALLAVSIDRKDANHSWDLCQRLDAAGGLTHELVYNLGLLLQQSGQHEEAAACYRQATELAPEFSPALLNLGHTLKALGREDEARQAWDRAMETDPALASSH